MPVEPAMGAHSTATDDLGALVASWRRSLAARRSLTARNRHRGVQAFLVWCVGDDLRAKSRSPKPIVADPFDQPQEPPNTEIAARLTSSGSSPTGAASSGSGGCASPSNDRSAVGRN